MMGRVNSIQSLAAVDGPGVRFAVFLQGCNLRCGCCHNPDTWDMNGGAEYSPEEIVAQCERYREYFGENGGITLSGGEPLLQADFVRDVFSLCRERKINTCLDTSGSIINDKIKKALSFCDRVLLDIKYTSDDLYLAYVGCPLEGPLEFLRYLDEIKMPTTIRQVIIPDLNDQEENIHFLSKLKAEHECVDKIEFLPFRKMCRVKYEKMGMDFPFEKYSEPSISEMKKLNDMISIK